MNQMGIRQSRTFLLAFALLIFNLISIQNSNFANAANLNSHCTEAQWLAGSKIKVGKVTAQCVAGPDNYYWINVKEISPDAAKAGPLERISRTKATATVTVYYVPDVVGLDANRAMSAILSAGLSPVHVYRSQGGQAGASCAMTNSGIVMGQSPRAGAQVRAHSPVQFATSC